MKALVGLTRLGAALVGVAAVALLGAGSVSTISPQARLAGDASSDSQKLGGSWLVTVTTGEGATFLALMTFTPTGEVLEESNAATIRSLAHGEWVRTGDQQFTRTFVSFRFDGATTRRFIGTLRVTADMRLEQRDEFRAEARIELFDPDGNLVGTGRSTEVGRRLDVGEFGNWASGAVRGPVPPPAAGPSR